MADLKKFEGALDQMIHLMMDMKESLSDGKEESAPKPEVQPEVKSQSVEDDYGSFEQLKKALKSENWPEAVNPNLICNPTSPQDKIERGRGIIELMIEEDLKGLRFLDAGCGEGHCASLSTEYGTKTSVGFDIKEHESWKSFVTDSEQRPLNLTTDFEVVKANGPYDIITIFDVLDHLKGMDAVTFLQACGSVLEDTGKIYMRCHPFTSRHATHHYHDINKAYVHLVFTEEELKQLVPDSQHKEDNIGVLYPLRTYNDYITKSGLRVLNRRDITEKVEPFFKIPKIAERIIKRTDFDKFPEFQMSLQFIDFVLGK
jgi:2-polyprenyl-3-methyl-5-hydroxy-6-metoxy-1,4-benzoquinol methylase